MTDRYPRAEARYRRICALRNKIAALRDCLRYAQGKVAARGEGERFGDAGREVGALTGMAGGEIGLSVQPRIESGATDARSRDGNTLLLAESSVKRGERAANAHGVYNVRALSERRTGARADSRFQPDIALRESERRLGALLEETDRLIRRMDDPGQALLMELLFLQGIDRDVICAGLGLSRSGFRSRLSRGFAALEQLESGGAEGAR